ncbi:CDP-alcohol phosphatidyltransferase family protein [Jannaschia rubra]|nr:CDP-alcohol phosphatidyltransferase family protein [Jannaschia rubra]
MSVSYHPSAGARRMALALAPAVILCGWFVAGGVSGAVMAGMLWGGVMAAVRTFLPAYHPHRRFGAANGVTTLRAAGVAVLAAATLHGPGGPFDGWPLVAAVAALLALDGVDGTLARRTGLASRFGARFDMEVDAAFALVLTLLLWRTQGMGAWVLLLGLPRYAFVLAGRIVPSLTRDLPPSWARKAVCVQQIATLCLLFVPGLPQEWAFWLGGAAVATLAWSFGRDILWLRRAATTGTSRPAAPPQGTPVHRAPPPRPRPQP